MHIHQALGIARQDERRLTRFIDRRGRFLDALDWDALPEQTAREASMLDELLEADLAESSAYVDWLEGCVATASRTSSASFALSLDRTLGIRRGSRSLERTRATSRLMPPDRGQPPESKSG